MPNTSQVRVSGAFDYYPFGMQMPGRVFSYESGYTFRFNGQLKDNDISGDGNDYNFKFRIFDSRLGKFLSIDPLSKKYPFNSPYAFAENKVIRYDELEGKETSDQMAIGALWHSAGINTVTADQVVDKTKDYINRMAIASADVLIVGAGALTIALTGGLATPGVIGGEVAAASVIAYSSASIAVVGGSAKMVFDVSGNKDASDKIPTSLAGVASLVVDYTVGKNKYSMVIDASLEVTEAAITLDLKNPDKLISTIKNMTKNSKDFAEGTDKLVTIVGLTVKLKDSYENFKNEPDSDASGNGDFKAPTNDHTATKVKDYKTIGKSKDKPKDK